MITGDFAPQARLSQHLKDVRLILAESRRSGCSTPLSKLHQTLLEQAEDLGFGFFGIELVDQIAIGFAKFINQPPHGALLLGTGVPIRAFQALGHRCRKTTRPAFQLARAQGIGYEPAGGEEIHGALGAHPGSLGAVGVTDLAVWVDESLRGRSAPFSAFP